MEQQIGEHETKFVIANRLTHKLVSWLRDRCILDPEYPVGKISSIYFDTRDWALLREKINSDYLKTKVRLRWYSDATTGKPWPKSYIEVKLKVGSSRQKIRILSDLDAQWVAQASLADAAFLHIPRFLRQQGVVLPGALYPALQVDYTRIRFVDPLSGARLCVDYNIHAARCHLAMLNRLRTYPLENAVFELKEKAGLLPDWLHQVAAFGCRRGAFSKFSACYQQATSTQF
jgi:hypothetical protein